jgi:hypothetical protein
MTQIASEANYSEPYFPTTEDVLGTIDVAIDSTIEKLDGAGDHLHQGSMLVAQQVNWVMNKLDEAHEQDNVLAAFGYTALSMPALPYLIGGLVAQGYGNLAKATADDLRDLQE